MEDHIPKKHKPKSQELANSIMPLDSPEKEDFELNKYIDHTCHNTPGNSAPGNNVNKILLFDSNLSEEWIIFVDSLQKSQ